MSNMRYISPLTDFGFRKVFSNEEVAAAFLNDLLQPASAISHVAYLELESPLDNEGVTFHMQCKCDDGSEMIVMMHNKGNINFINQILYALTLANTSQVKKGYIEWNYNPLPVYVVFFFDFCLPGFAPRALRTIQFKESETDKAYSDKLNAITIETPSCRNIKMEECKSGIDYWLYNLSNMGTMTSDIPFQEERPIFGKIAGMTELSNMTDEERLIINNND